jgi:hypothetical protein
MDDRHPLISLLLEHVAGETITLKVLRDGETIQTTLTLGNELNNLRYTPDQRGVQDLFWVFQTEVWTPANGKIGWERVPPFG